MKNIWVVCSYFNFTKTPFRLKNFNIFRDNIKRYGNLKLLCVEFSPSKCFEIVASDVDMLLQLSDGDIMWQKERLINIGIDALPENTDIVIICDADIVFTDDDFTEKLTKSLERYSAVQCFSIIRSLSPNKNETNFDYFNVDFNSLDAFALSAPSCIMTYSLYGNFAGGAAGYMWAFNYKIIKNIKLFDINIIGSGDRVSAAAFIGLPLAPWLTVGGQNAVHYYKYLNNVKNAGINRDTVGYIDMQIYDLYHGLHEDRKYNQRHAILQDMGFLPERDLISSKGAVHKFSEGFSQSSRDKIKNYFYSRNEMPVRKTV
jgi:hypothetical protein